MVRKNIRLLNKDLQVLFQSIELNKEFKEKKIRIGSHKTINTVFKNNLSIKNRQYSVRIFFIKFRSLIKSFENNFVKYIYIKK